MSLDKFIANVKTGGLARTNRYTVSFNPRFNKGIEKTLLYCDQIQLPSLNFSTIQNRSFGEFREVPYEKLFGDISMSFYVDTDMEVKFLFDQWMAFIQDPTTRTFEYYNNYTCDMRIKVESDTSFINKRDTEIPQTNVHYEVVLYECYPKTMGAIQLDYASKDIMKLSVTMQYKYFKTNVINTAQNNQIVTTQIQEPSKNFTGNQAFRSQINDYNPIVIT